VWVALAAPAPRTAPARALAGRGRDRVHFRRIADGSLLEAECTLDIAAAAGWVAPDAEARALIKQLGAMLWPLVK
jgi:hypothetical protein